MEKIINCLLELEKLKLVERGLNVGDRKESSAEHSWSSMLIADILIDYVDEPLDRLKVLEFLLYHDVVEVYAGDAKFANAEEMKLKDQKEAESMKMILALMPKSTRFNNIIEEYELRETREAKYAKAIDCIDALIRKLNDDNKVEADGFTLELIHSKYKPHVSRFDFIDELFEELIRKLIEKNKFRQ